MQHCSPWNINHWTLVIVETAIEIHFKSNLHLRVSAWLILADSDTAAACVSPGLPRQLEFFKFNLKFNLKLAASWLKLVLPVFKFCSSILPGRIGPLPPGSWTRSSSSESIQDHFDHDATDILIMIKIWGIHLTVCPDLQCRIQVTHCQRILIFCIFFFLCHWLRICQNTKYANKGAQNFIMLRISRKCTWMSNWDNASGLCSLFPHPSSGILRWIHW